MKCDHPDCQEETLTECFYPDNQSGIPNNHYCYTHAPQHGFCYGCGEFWGGVESFDFASALGGIPGYCENCADAIRADVEGDDDYYDEYDEYCYY